MRLQILLISLLVYCAMPQCVRAIDEQDETCGEHKCQSSETCVQVQPVAEITRLRAEIGQLEARHNAEVKAQSDAFNAAAAQAYESFIYTDEKTAFACEGNVLAISCPKNMVIDVTQGFYGRLADAYCVAEPILSRNCSLTTADAVFRSVCSNRQSCTIRASNDNFANFGDPCPGTTKYMKVKYRCRVTSEKREKFDYACEHDTLTLSCPANSKIEVIDAFYGRKTNDFCAIGPRSNLNCNAVSASATVKSQCDNKQTCRVSIENSVFTDPCVGTFKYSTVKYRCMESNAISEAVACESSSLTIRCPENYAICVIQGFFGRVSNEFCPARPQTSSPCRSINADKVIHKLCDKKQSCSFNSSCQIFDDTCPGTAKYAKVDYKCQAFSPEKIARVCEGATVEIGCPGDFLIVVSEGFYGRGSNLYCPITPPNRVSCSAPSAHSRIRAQCNLQLSCSFSSSDSFFGNGTCPGISKYATIKYKCMLPSDILRAADSSIASFGSKFSQLMKRLEMAFKRKLGVLQHQLSKAESSKVHQCVQAEQPVD